MSTSDASLFDQLTRLLTAASVEDVLVGASKLLAEVSGARAAGLLLSAGIEVSAEYWHGADEPLRQRLHAALGTARLGPKIQMLRLAEPEALSVRISSLRSGEHQLGVVLLAFSGGTLVGGAVGDEKGLASADRVARLVADRLAGDRQLSALQTELSQVRRWFDTMDSQLRVLDRERQKFAAVVSQSDTLMLVADQKQRVQWANAALTVRLAELGSDRAAGLAVQTIWDILEVDCAPSGSSGCPIARALRSGEVVHDESRQHVDDGARTLYLTALPIKAPDGETAEVLVMIQDLSDLEVLRRSEARYRLLFEESPNAMIMAAPTTGEILLSNPAATGLTGYAPRELASVTLEALYEPKDWHGARRGFNRVHAEERVVYAEHRLRTKHGTALVVDVTATRFDLDGEPVTLVQLQDVTEQRRLEAELTHSQKMEAVGRLAGGIAHEFNNIMTIVLGQTELLNAQLGLDDRVRGIAETTAQAAMRAAFLTRKLLTFSRKEVVRAEVLDLADVLRSIQALVRHLLGERVTLHLSTGSDPCLVRADRWQLEQVVINLTANARDAMVRGGNFWLELSHHESAEPDDDGQVVISLRDDGIGMDAETQAHLFEPFFTTKGPGKGTGLGLSTVYRIVEGSGGTIEVKSSPGEGTTFRIILPSAGLTASKPPPAEPAAEQRASAEERILVVDDEAELRRMAARLLKLDGYAVTIAGSGEEALSICEAAEAPFDLLLTDVVMPGMTGGELTRKVRERFPETRVIYMSGYSDEEVVRYGVSSSDAAFIQKPFTRRDLSQRVREVLDGQR